MFWYNQILLWSGMCVYIACHVTSLINLSKQRLIRRQSVLLTDEHYLRCLTLQSWAAMSSPSAQELPSLLGRCPGSLWRLKVDSALLVPTFSWANKGSLFLSSRIINIFSSIFKSGNASIYLNSCLLTSNVTFLFYYLPGSHLSPFPYLHLFCLKSSLMVALLVSGMRLGFRCGLQMPNGACACTGFLVCSETKGSFPWCGTKHAD